MAGTVFLRMDFGRGRYFTPTHAVVLMAVEKYGSVQLACAALERTYRKTAILIRFMNRSYGDVIVTGRGRQGGAGRILRRAARNCSRSIFASSAISIGLSPPT